MQTKTNISSGTFRDVYEEGDQFVVQNRIPFPGQTMKLQDGREFVFVSSDADIGINRFVAVGQAIPTADILMANKVAVTAKFSKTVTVTTTGEPFYGGSDGVIAADVLAGGYLYISSGNDRGAFAIKGHTEGTASASIVFTLEEEIPFAIVGTNKSVINGPHYKNVVLDTGTLDTIGITVSAITAATDSARKYFWLQTRGFALAFIKTGAGMAIGDNASCSTSGGVKLTADDKTPVVGVCAWTDTTDSNTVGMHLRLG